MPSVDITKDTNLDYNNSKEPKNEEYETNINADNNTLLKTNSELNSEFKQLTSNQDDNEMWVTSTTSETSSKSLKTEFCNIHFQKSELVNISNEKNLEITHKPIVNVTDSTSVLKLKESEITENCVNTENSLHDKMTHSIKFNSQFEDMNADFEKIETFDKENYYLDFSDKSLVLNTNDQSGDRLSEDLTDKQEDISSKDVNEDIYKSKDLSFDLDSESDCQLPSASLVPYQDNKDDFNYIGIIKSVRETNNIYQAEVEIIDENCIDCSENIACVSNETPDNLKSMITNVKSDVEFGEFEMDSFKNGDFTEFADFNTYAFHAYFPKANSSDVQNENLNNAIEILKEMFPNIQKTIEDCEIFDFYKEDVIFKELKDVMESKALSYQWTKSCSQKSLLKSLNIDMRNIVSEFLFKL